jgi:hypothetical protein
VEVVSPNICNSRQTVSPYLQRNYDKLSEISVTSARRHATHLSGAPRVLELVRCLTGITGTCIQVVPQLYSGEDPPCGHAAARNQSLNVSDHDFYEYNNATFDIPHSLRLFPDAVFQKLGLFPCETYCSGWVGPSRNS